MTSHPVGKVFFLIVLGMMLISLSTQASDSSTCVYGKKIYSHGALVVMDEPCLGCSCNRGQLVCHLRMCPTLPEVTAKNCKIEKPDDKCCARITCGNFSRNSTGFGKFVRTNQVGRNDDDSFYYYRRQLRRPTPSPVEPTSQKFSGCKVNETFFADGSALPSNSTCRHCYCLRGNVRCIKPKCHLNIEGCEPKYSHEHSCCPTHYDCSALAEMSLENEKATTIAPTKVCLWNGKRYMDGNRISTDDICRSCFCVRGTVKCTTQTCTASSPGCTPIVQPGHCCPLGFQCDYDDDYPTDEELLDYDDHLSSDKENVTQKIRENDRVIDLDRGGYQLVKRTSDIPSRRNVDRKNGFKRLRPVEKFPSRFRIDSENDKVETDESKITRSKKPTRSATSMLYFPPRVNNRRNLFPKRHRSTTPKMETSPQLLDENKTTTIVANSSTPMPESTTTMPETTTTTKIPETTTTTTTKIPETTTTTTTKIPETTTTMSETTTTMPETTTTMPETTTTMPETTITTKMPETTTTKPETTTTMPDTTTTMPKTKRTRTKTTTNIPQTTTKTKTMPEITTTMPERSTTILKTTSTRASTSFTVSKMSRRKFSSTTATVKSTMSAKADGEVDSSLPTLLPFPEIPVEFLRQVKESPQQHDKTSKIITSTTLTLPKRRIEGIKPKISTKEAKTTESTTSTTKYDTTQKPTENILQSVSTEFTTFLPVSEEFHDGHHKVDVEESGEFDGLHGEPAAIDWPSPLDGDVFDYFREFSHVSAENDDKLSAEVETTTTTTTTTTPTSTTPTSTTTPILTSSSPPPTTQNLSTTTVPITKSSDVPTTTTKTTTLSTTTTTTTPSESITSTETSTPTIFLRRVGLNVHVADEKPTVNSETNWTMRLIPEGHPAADATARLSKVGTATIQRLPHFESRGSTRLLVADDEIVKPKSEMNKKMKNVDKNLNLPQMKSDDSIGFRVIPFLPEDAIVGEPTSDAPEISSRLERNNSQTSGEFSTINDKVPTVTGNSIGSVSNFFINLLEAVQQTINDNTNETSTSFPERELEKSTPIDVSRWIPIRGETESNNVTDNSDLVIPNDEDRNLSPYTLGLLSLFGFSGLGGASRRNENQSMLHSTRRTPSVESSESNGWLPVKVDGLYDNDTGVDEGIFTRPISTAALSGMRMPNATGSMYLIGQPKEESLEPLPVEKWTSRDSTSTTESLLSMILNDIQKSSRNDRLTTTGSDPLDTTWTTSTASTINQTDERGLTATQIVSIIHKVDNNPSNPIAQSSDQELPSTRLTSSTFPFMENGQSATFDLNMLFSSPTVQENLFPTEKYDNFPIWPPVQPVGNVGIDDSSFSSQLEAKPDQNTNENLEKSTLDTFDLPQDESENEAGNFNPFILQVKGCDIYGKYYNMGDVILELSSNCEQCVCSGFGVDCHQTC